MGSLDALNWRRRSGGRIGTFCARRNIIGFIKKAVGSLTGANDAAEGAGKAAKTQAQAAQAGIDEQKRQFDSLQKLLQPFVGAGTEALTGQQDFLGLNGMGAQLNSIFDIQQSPMFTALQAQGENSILQNASATGGLRGGNTQAALAQFSPQLLNQLIDQQYGRLGGLAGLGQNAAAGVGNAGIQTGRGISELLKQQGAARAGGQLAQGQLSGNQFSGLSGMLGAFSGIGGVSGIKKLF